MTILTPYAKAILAIVAAAFAVLTVALTDNVVTPTEATNVGIAVVTATGVYLVPNLQAGPARYLKLAVALLGAALAALVAVLTDGVTASEWLTVILAALAAIGIGIVPNTPVIDAGTAGTGPSLTTRL